MTVNEKVNPAFGPAQLPAFRLFVLMLVLMLTFGATVQAMDLPSGIWFTQIFIFLLPPILVARTANLSPSFLLRFSFNLPWPLIILIILASTANYMVAAGMMVFMENVIPLDWPRMDASRVLEAEQGWRLGIIIAGVLFAAPVCEEAAFRGFIQQSFVARIGAWPGIVAAATLFSALHFDAVGFASRLELGILFGWLLWRTGSVWAPIIAHAVNNGVAMLLFYLIQNGAITESQSVEKASTGSLIYLVGLGLVILLPLLMLIHRATKDTPQAKPGIEIKALEPSRPLGLSPAVTMIMSLMILSLTFAVALSMMMSRSHPPDYHEIESALQLGIQDLRGI